MQSLHCKHFNVTAMFLNNDICNDDRQLNDNVKLRIKLSIYKMAAQLILFLEDQIHLDF